MPYSNILVVDTALRHCTVMVARDKSIFYDTLDNVRRGQDGQLPGLVVSVMAEAGIGLKDIDGFGGVTGPGSFTGIRIGMAYLHGLAMVKNRPLAGISNFELLAACHDTHEPFYAAVPIKSTVCALQMFDAEGQRSGTPIQVDTDAVSALDHDVILPRAALTTVPQLEQVSHVIIIEPDYDRMAESVRRQLNQKGTFQPDYIRQADVTISSDRMKQ